LALEIEALEQNGRRPAHNDDVAADGVQVIGDLLDPLERIFEGLPIAATKTHEGRHDFYSVRCPVVPEMKAFAPMRRFDQSDARAPSKHVTFPSSYSSNRRALMPSTPPLVQPQPPRERSVRQLVSKTRPCFSDDIWQKNLDDR
jgi:hypothetical protein